jgi:hypothetical protein
MFLFEKTEGISRIFMAWLFICLLLFSPARYLILQIFVATAYPFQSLHALFTIIILAFYIPIVFGILYAIGIGLPLISLVLIAGKDATSKIRLWLLSFAAPIIFLVGSFLFFLILPYAAYSTHWLSTKDVIRATNGPPEYFYRYAMLPIEPLARSAFEEEIGLKMSAKEILRAHVASIYLSNRGYVYYVSKTYPDYFEELKRRYELSQQQVDEKKK